MRIKKTDTRERKWENLKEATGKGHTSQALDVAADYYLRMVGGNEAYPHGAVDDLLSKAEDEGSLTAEEIAEELDTPQLPVEYETSRQVGPDP